MAFTFFFRDQQTLDLIQKYVIPVLRSRRFIHIWDAGCATGPEPYSLAILIRESMSEFLFRNVRILATDINGNFGKIIREGIYSKDEVGRIPEAILFKYFSPVNGRSDHYIISEQIRRSVEFLKHDLLSFDMPRKGFCLILCKNVLLHFQQEDQIKVIQMFYDALECDGYFATEQTQKLPKSLFNKFEQVVLNAQLYKKK
ncbi:MAG: CheR family methyltransferase [bacterium]